MSDLPSVRDARPDELADWDAWTVSASGGDVQQSLAWAEHRRRTGWRPHRLVLGDGGRVLALGRPWPLLGGGLLYLPKGPVTGDAPVEVVADRLAAVAAWARAAGYDAVRADAEVPAATGYPAFLAARGFTPVEEVGPSRNRVAVPVPPGATDEALLAMIAKTTRQRFLAAERKGTRIVRHDRLGPDGVGAGFEAPGGAGGVGGAGRAGRPGDIGAGAVELEAFERFHDLLAATGERRGFAIAPRAAATAWWRAALDAGHLALLEAWSAEGTYLGGAIFYRHGQRLTYASSGDVVAMRHAHPGTVHLVLWRALQLAAREGRAELDLGGVDVAGARHEPRPGEPMFGLYEFKQAFGGRWLELSGAHQRVLRPRRWAAGRALSTAARVPRRVATRLRGRRE